MNAKITGDSPQVQHYWFWDVLARDIAGRIFDWVYGQNTCGGTLCLWVSVSRAFASDWRCGLRRFHVRGDRRCCRKPSSNHKVSAGQKRPEDCRCQQLVVYPGRGVWSRHQRAGWCRGASVNFVTENPPKNGLIMFQVYLKSSTGKIWIFFRYILHRSASLPLKVSRRRVLSLSCSVWLWQMSVVRSQMLRGQFSWLGSANFQARKKVEENYLNKSHTHTVIIYDACRSGVNGPEVVWVYPCMTPELWLEVTYAQRSFK